MSTLGSFWRRVPTVSSGWTRRWWRWTGCPRKARTFAFWVSKCPNLFDWMFGTFKSFTSKKCDKCFGQICKITFTLFSKERQTGCISSGRFQEAGDVSDAFNKFLLSRHHRWGSVFTSNSKCQAFVSWQDLIRLLFQTCVLTRRSLPQTERPRNNKETCADACCYWFIPDKAAVRCVFLETRKPLNNKLLYMFGK